ncbi:hypothetical protein [Spirosoma jeollabukense]
MKILAQSILTALLLSTATLVSTAATTAENPAAPTATTSSYKVAVFPSSSAPKLNVYVERKPGQFMLISLKSLDGALLSKQLVGKKEGNFHFKFDLSDLQDGQYKVEVVSGNDVTVHPVTLTTKPAQIAARVLTLN